MPIDPEKRYRIEQAKAQIIDELTKFNDKSRKNCRIILEGVIDDETSNLEDLVKYYSYCYQKPVLALAQDIQRQAAIYANLLEDIKSLI